MSYSLDPQLTDSAASVHVQVAALGAGTGWEEDRTVANAMNTLCLNSKLSLSWTLFELNKDQLKV